MPAFQSAGRAWLASTNRCLGNIGGAMGGIIDFMNSVEADASKLQTRCMFGADG